VEEIQVAKQTRSTGKWFVVDYEITFAGTVRVEAKGFTDAENIVRDQMAVNKLIRIAADRQKGKASIIRTIHYDDVK
jgi:hypothetical protein